VIEVDSRSTQEWKKRRVKEVLGAIPPNVTFAPMDFSHDSLPDVLSGVGHDASQPTLYTCEGVSMYLTESTVRQTLQSVAAHSAAGSSMVIEYAGRGAIDFVQKHPMGSVKYAADWGEPWTFGVPDDRDREFFAGTGLELKRRLSLTHLGTAKKYAWRRKGTFYGAHLTSAFNARTHEMMRAIPPADLALAARSGYWLAELVVP
jgi:methyltransferase (TIGR00027 family)